MLSSEVQGYLRHALHSIGMLLVAYGGVSEEMIELYVGVIVSVTSLIWFGVAKYREYKKKKSEKGCECATEHCECNINESE